MNENDEELITKTQMLIDLDIGDRGRLEYIKDSLHKENTLYTSDKKYLEKLISQNLDLDYAKEDTSSEKTIIETDDENGSGNNNNNNNNLTTTSKFTSEEKNHDDNDGNQENTISSSTARDAKRKVSLVWQIILSFIPIIDIWVFYRIKKLRWYFLIFYVGAGIPFIIPLAIFFASFTPVEEISDFVEDPNISLTYSIIGTAALALHVYLVVKWSKDWNAKILGQKFEKPLSKRIIIIVAIVVLAVMGLEFGSAFLENNFHVLLGYPLDGKVSASIARGTPENPQSRLTVLINNGEVPLFFDDDNDDSKSIFGIREANTGKEFTVCAIYPKISVLMPDDSWESAPYTCEKTGRYSFSGLSLLPGQYEMYLKCTNEGCNEIKPFTWKVDE